MTREEAIKIIDCYDIGFYDLSGEKIPADKLADAFDMAIEALQAEETIEIKPMEIKGDFHIDDDYKKPPQIIGNVEVVVRCKDCRHAYFKDFDGYCPHMVNMLKPDGFCYRGERQCNYFGERREP
jgi:hypothetical protein